MKRLVIAAFLLGLLGVGCMENHLVPPGGLSSAKTPPRPEAPPVTPDKVTTANPWEMVRGLEEELHNAAPPQGIQPTPPSTIPDDPDTK